MGCLSLVTIMLLSPKSHEELQGVGLGAEALVLSLLFLRSKVQHLIGVNNFLATPLDKKLAI